MKMAPFQRKNMNMKFHNFHLPSFHLPCFRKPATRETENNKNQPAQEASPPPGLRPANTNPRRHSPSLLQKLFPRKKNPTRLLMQTLLRQIVGLILSRSIRRKRLPRQRKKWLAASWVLCPTNLFRRHRLHRVYE